MKKRLKQSVGIDVSQKVLEVCLGYLDENLNVYFQRRKTFSNNAKGFLKLVEWIRKELDKDVEILVVMEATGVYHENCAHTLYANNFDVSIVLPNKISNYVRSLNQKTKTDSKDAQAICQFGLERKETLWTPPKSCVQTNV